jgi:subtilisin family serine protease
MGQVFDSQFRAMADGFARQGIVVEVAYAPSGRADYLYQAGRLLARADAAADVERALPGAFRVERGEPHPPSVTGLAVLNIDSLSEGFLAVPQALDVLDRRLGWDPAPADGFPAVSPVHAMYIANGAQPGTVRACPATEPEVPCCCDPEEPCGTCPPAAGDGGAGTVIGICDTGLLADLTPAPWLAGVTAAPGAVDPLGAPLPGGLSVIPRYCGHGTFIAGVARCQAPAAAVVVTSDFAAIGAALEWVVVQALEELIAGDPVPQVVNLSAGSYTRHDWKPLSFLPFNHGDIALTAAAGNDATDRKFWPAAFDWAIAVGALGADRRHRAWFSNYGDWVDVYTLGEGLVNAFATGEYTYQEPPRRPSVQDFHGLARWSGTSFAAPLAAGLIAAEMTTGAGLGAADAAAAVLARAQAQSVPGTGPVLYPRQP